MLLRVKASAVPTVSTLPVVPLRLGPWPSTRMLTVRDGVTVTLSPCLAWLPARTTRLLMVGLPFTVPTATLRSGPTALVSNTTPASLTVRVLLAVAAVRPARVPVPPRPVSLGPTTVRVSANLPVPVGSPLMTSPLASSPVTFLKLTSGSRVPSRTVPAASPSGA